MFKNIIPLLIFSFIEIQQFPKKQGHWRFLYGAEASENGWLMNKLSGILKLIILENSWQFGARYYSYSKIDQLLAENCRNFFFVNSMFE